MDSKGGIKLGKVYRRQRIEGVTVPAVIHNSQYFWHNMAVYEDGTVSCWKKVDLEDVLSTLNRGWLTVSVPEGKSLSVHGACCFEIKNAKWNFTNESYFEFIKDTVRSMNPEMANIYKTSDHEREKWDKLRIGFTASPTHCKLIEMPFKYEFTNGDGTNIFMRVDGSVTLTALYAYEDGFFGVDGLNKILTFDDIEKLFAEKKLCTAPKDGEIISLGALGTAECASSYSKVKQKEKLKEIENMSLKIQKKPDAHELCIRAYHAYLVEPSEFYKERLRKAYEAVPEHERCFLGDMDSRDSDFRRILYSNNKREV